LAWISINWRVVYIRRALNTLGIVALPYQSSTRENQAWRPSLGPRQLNQRF